MEKFNSLIYILLGLIIGINAMFFFYDKNKSSLPDNREKLTTDTIIKIIQPKPVIIVKTKANIIRLKDTVLTKSDSTGYFQASEPKFISSLDTIVNNDTVHAEYQYPENLFSLQIYKMADSLKIPQTIITRTIEKEKPWWEVPVYVSAGAVLGYLLSSIRK